MWFLATAKRVISGGSDSFGMPSVANLGGKFWYHPTMPRWRNLDDFSVFLSSIFSN